MIAKLKKELKLMDIFSIATGAMISSGLFILPGLAHAKAGPAVVVSYFLAGLLAMTGMLSQAELVSAMPKSGGTYFYVTRSMGPAVGTIEGIVEWLAISFKSAFALVGIAAFVKFLIPVNIHLTGPAIALVFVLINFLGVGKAGKIQTVMVTILLALLGIYVADGLLNIKIYNFENFAPNGPAAVFSTAGYVFISYGGILKVTSVAEEAKNPAKTIPLAMILSLFVVITLYVFVVFVTTGVLSSEALDNSLTPITDGATAFMGPIGTILLSAAAVLAFISTANAGIMAAARYPLALSRDGLLPAVFGAINRKFKTPHISLISTGAFIIAVLFMQLDVLVKAASTVMILSFLLACLAVIILRESRVQNYLPSFKSPLYPWIQIIGIAGFFILIFAMGKHALYTSGVLFTSGFLIYWLYGRNVSREYALIHLIERIMDTKLAGNVLESELKDIIRERDEIVKDRFDHQIEKSIFFDLDKRMSLDEFLTLASKAIAEKMDRDPDSVYRSLMEREEKTNTAINNFVAIPHIIIEGKNEFEILVARCRKGIKFSETNDSIKAVFILIGTVDERNFHLRSLSAIAQIVQNPDFEKMWIKAKGINNLRDIILLGKRKRDEEKA